MAMIVPKKKFFLTPTKSVETLSLYVAVHGKLPKKKSIQKSLIQLFRIDI